MDSVPVIEEVKEVKEEVVAESAKEPENEFSYIKENGFTSEIFKVEIRGLPRFYGVGVSRRNTGCDTHLALKVTF